jgi:alkyl sulfatase BDS1-like metallo-beta-lactamase superfamily hydrolase
VNGLTAGETDLAFTVVFADTGERFAVRLENAVLRHRPGDGGPEARVTRDGLIDLVMGAKPPEEVEVAGEGSEQLHALLGLLDRFDLWFEIAAP